MISVVIPVYNEEKVLPATLRCLFAQPGEYEVIVVDGGSMDRTREIVDATRATHHALLCDEALQRAGASPVTLITASKGRAVQMNAGAKEARGEWLLFLHADTWLPDSALVRLNQMEGDANVQAGGFLHQFSGDDWRLRMISFLDNFRCLRSRIIYGDQAMFVRRVLFERLGGFPNQPILEDVAFCEKLIRVTEPVLLGPPVVTDPRKFVQMGVWKSLARVLLIILHAHFRLPVLPRAFFQDIR